MGGRATVGLIADVKLMDPHRYHCVGDKYTRAVADFADALPLLVPSMADALDVSDILAQFDGLVFTGSYSNILPRFYNSAEEPFEGSLADEQRDLASLPLLRAAIANGTPVFGICRGFQEMNVAYGGTLYQKVHEQPGFDSHLENPADPLDVQYGPAHRIDFTPGGFLATLTGDASADVNSVHGQGVRALGERLVVEATAPDGLIEAFSVRDARSFALGVQWHPEWMPQNYPFYQTLWGAFGEACASYSDRRQHSRVA